MQTINNTTSEDARKGEGSNGQLGTEIQSSRADGTKGCNQLIKFPRGSRSQPSRAEGGMGGDRGREEEGGGRTYPCG
jgi:hypothetical protein